jgi:hypothetical protein
VKSQRKKKVGGATFGGLQRREEPLEFNPDYTYVKRDLRRIAILAGSIFAVLIVLSFILPLILR